MKLSTSIILFSILFFACEEAPKKTPKIEVAMSNELLSYIGTYTRAEGHVDGKAAGIYRIAIDTVTGKISDQKTVASIINPSFLKLSKDGNQLYAVSELAHENEPTGYLYQYKIMDDSLEFVQRLATEGQAPCHIGLDQSGQYIFVTNYVGGLLKVYKHQENGSITDIQSIQLEGSSVHPQQDSPHLHSTKVSPNNQWVAVADKGTDKIWLFQLDLQKEALVPHPQVAVEIQAGAGPRHLSWSADGQFLYVINELDNSINVIQYNAKNERFTSIQSVSTLPKDYQGTSYCADLHLHPNGQFLYGSNRGHNSIAIYRIAPKTGLLTSLGFESTRGDFPRNFSISPKGDLMFVANQNTSNITSYRIHASAGTLQYLDLDYTIDTPVCIEY